MRRHAALSLLRYRAIVEARVHDDRNGRERAERRGHVLVFIEQVGRGQVISLEVESGMPPEVIEMPGPDGPRWDCPPVDVHLVFPSRRELALSVRAFVDLMKEMNPPGMHWQDNELHAIE